jgi:hypothetical protein
MKRNNKLLMMGALVALLSVPVALWFAFDAIPPLASIKTEASGNRMGPWMFTWALVWIAVIAAVLVAGLCYLSARLPGGERINSSAGGQTRA